MKLAVRFGLASGLAGRRNEASMLGSVQLRGRGGLRNKASRVEVKDSQLQTRSGRRNQGSWLGSFQPRDRLLCP